MGGAAASGAMNATALLAIQHWNLDRQLGCLEVHAKSGRRAFATAVVEELIAHLAMEKNVFYPLAEEVGGRLLAEEREAHRAVLRCLKKALVVLDDDDAFEERVRALRDAFDDHATTDERVVHAVLAELSLRELSAVGARMKDFYDACLRARRDAANAA